MLFALVELASVRICCLEESDSPRPLPLLHLRPERREHWLDGEPVKRVVCHLEERQDQWDLLDSREAFYA